MYTVNDLEDEVFDFIDELEDDSSVVESVLVDDEDLKRAEESFSTADSDIVFDFSDLGNIDSEEAELVREAFGPFGKRKPIEKILASREKLIRRRCKTIEDCNAISEAFKIESSKFVESLKAMQSITKKLADGKIDKAEAKRLINPYVKTLKSQSDLLQYGQIVQNSMNVTDEDIKFLSDYNKGISEIIRRITKEISNRKATENYTSEELTEISSGFENYMFSPQDLLYGGIDDTGHPMGFQEAYEFLMDVSEDDIKAAKEYSKNLHSGDVITVDDALEGINDTIFENYGHEDIGEGLYDLDSFMPAYEDYYDDDDSDYQSYDNDDNGLYDLDSFSSYDDEIAEENYDDDTDESTLDEFEIDDFLDSLNDE